MKNKQLFKETVTERSGHLVIASNICIATEKEITDEEELHKQGQCTGSIVYDEDCWPYYIRLCGICNRSLGTV